MTRLASPASPLDSRFRGNDENQNLPPISHVRGKGSEVNRNEGLRAKLGVRLNRLVRRTHGYGKRLYMLVGSLAMVWLRGGLHQRQRV